MKQETEKHWESMHTAPKDRPIWLKIDRWERIAAWGPIPDMRHKQGDDWNFQSRQVNHWLYEGKGQLFTPTAWSELDWPDQEDPANLGRPTAVRANASSERAEGLNIPRGLQAARASYRTSDQLTLHDALERSQSDHPSE